MFLPESIFWLEISGYKIYGTACDFITDDTVKKTVKDILKPIKSKETSG